MKKYRQGLLVFVSFLTAWILMILPLPHSWQWIRLEWLTLILIYWIFALPQSIGLVTAWCVGLVMDSLYGGTLGQQALSLMLVAFFARFLRYRIQLVPIYQQTLLIFALLAVGGSVSFLAELIMGHPPRTLLYWVPILLSVSVWPWFKRFMNFYERRVFA